MICQQYRLPAPPLGYWVKVRHGTKVRRRQMPEVTDAVLQNIHLIRLEPDLAPLLSLQPIPVPTAPHEPHASVREVQKWLKDRCAGAGTASRAHALAVACRVSEGLEDRALALLDALIKGFESAGGEIFANSDGRLWGRAPDGVGLSVRATENPVDAGGLPRLSIDITTNRRVAIKSHWTDTKNHRVEGTLRPIINSIFETVARLRRERLDQECSARQKQKMVAVAERRAQQQAEAAREQEFGRALLAEAERYEQATLLRRYVRAIRRQLARHQGSDALTVDEE